MDEKILTDVPVVTENVNPEDISDEPFEYDGYQVVRGEFFAHISEPSVTFKGGKVQANTAAVNKLPEVQFVQILVNPDIKKLAIRPCSEEDKDSFLWSAENKKNGRRKPRQITCHVFFAKMVELMNWNPEYRYKLLGKMVQSNGEYLFVFDLTASEVYQKVRLSDDKEGISRKPVFPAEWKNQFGLPIDEHRKQLQINIFDGYAVFGIADKKTNDEVKNNESEHKPETGDRPEEEQTESAQHDA